MIEFVIHGRGGRGGVTLAKLLAGVYYRRGLHVQAFGIYGAERTGAPVEAYVRVDESDLDVYGPIVSPDHVIIVDPSLAAPAAVVGERPGGWVIVNATQPPEAFAAVFPGRRVAAVDANGIAVAYHLGTRTVPIVNTALLGAAARVLGLPWDDVEGALGDAGLAGDNVAAARTAFAQVVTADEPGQIPAPAPEEPRPFMSFLDERVGTRPSTHTGAWASRRPRARELEPVCSAACPAGNDVRGFVRAAATGDDARALAVLLETSPLPGVCGRVCPAPCMTACSRRQVDAAVDVRDIERGLADRVARPRAGIRPGGAPVAVVGAGPAGLSAAYHLARLGHRVTVYEAAPEPGGLLRYGIPEYRLPRSVLEVEIAYILEHGVAVETGRSVDRAGLRRLAREHAALIVATGLQDPRDLDLHDGDGVEQGLRLLAAPAEEGAGLEHASVVVAGGGTTAMDAARTALRMGAREVRVVYRRTRAEMPAITEEVDEALAEGVVLDELMTPAGWRHDGAERRLVCRRMELGEPDESGRPRPRPVEGEQALVEVACDRLLLALGQTADLTPFAAPAGLAAGLLHLRGIATPVRLCGDLAAGEGTVAAAVGSGRRAALAVHGALSGKRLAEQHGTAPLAGADVVHLHDIPPVPSERVAVAAPARRRHSFTEVRRGFAPCADHDPVQAEAGRCFSCGACTGCDECVAYCPEGILRHGDAPAPQADYDYCKGCGLCAVVCPRGVLVTEAV